MSKDNLHSLTQPKPLEPEIYQFGYPRNDTTNVMASTSKNSPFLGTYDDMSLLESGLYHKKYGDIGDHYYRIQSKAGESIDPRLLTLVEFFRGLYARKREVLKNIFPELHNEFVDMFKKFGGMLSLGKSDQIKVRTLQRSLSVGSPRTLKNGDESPLRLERFKVRTVVPGGGAPSGQGDKGDTKSDGSNSK